MDAVRAQQATPFGTLRINAFASGAREIMAPLGLEFLRRHPAVHVDLVTGERLVDVDGPITLDEATLARMAVLQGVGIGFFLEQDVRDD
jgi:DNA-binding transcriptional LysR family regulator